MWWQSGGEEPLGTAVGMLMLCPLNAHLPHPDHRQALSCFILRCPVSNYLHCKSFNPSLLLTSRAAISLSLDKEGVIVRVIMVADMRTLGFCLFHICSYHTPPSPAFPHPCPLARVLTLLLESWSRHTLRPALSATWGARLNNQNWPAHSAPVPS